MSAENPEKEKMADDKERLRKPYITISFGMEGHENEYVIHNRPNGYYGEIKDIPKAWEARFNQELGKGWSLMYRSDRLEIKPPDINGKIERNSETDEKIRSILKSITENKYELKFS